MMKYKRACKSFSGFRICLQKSIYREWLSSSVKVPVCCVFSPVFSNLVRNYSARVVTNRNHYDTLKVSADATQAQIKEAYFQLSKLHHPDSSKGNADRFVEISNAYEIVGNVDSRRTYDKNLNIRRVKGKSFHMDESIFDSRPDRFRREQSANSSEAFDRKAREMYESMLRKSRNTRFDSSADPFRKDDENFQFGYEPLTKEEKEIELFNWIFMSLVLLVLFIPIQRRKDWNK